MATTRHNGAREGNVMEIERDFWAIALNETHVWMLDVLARKSGVKVEDIKEIRTVYIVDRTERTNLCEATPSYYLEPFDGIPILADGAEVSDEQLEALADEISVSVRGADWGGQYMHCRDLEFMFDEENEWSRRLGHYDSMDECIEDCCDNYPF
jgi:hypothetical protein